MSITKIVIHRVEVTIDSRAWELFGDKQELDFEIEQATRGCLTSGSYPDMGTLVWADFATHGEALRCDYKLQEVAARWQKKAQEYDEVAAKEQP